MLLLMLVEFDAPLIIILYMDIDNMDKLEELQLYTMCMCYFFVVKIIVIACAIRHHTLRNKVIEHKI